MRLRNFTRFDLFSSFHMRVNCWFLKSSTIDGTAPRLGGNTVGARDGQSVLPVAEDNRARRTSFISLFSLPTRRSICEGDDQVVTDRFDSVDVQRKFRGKILRLARLEIPRAVAVLAYDGDPLPVHMAVRQHGPLVRARLVHAIEVVAESHDHDVIPHDLEVRQGTIRDLLHLAQGDVLLHRRGEPGECLKDLRLTRLFDAEGRRANFSRRGRAVSYL